jgi:NADH-quinone oxidoreductase subunit B
VARYQLAENPDCEVEVLTAGLACCTLEVEAAVTAGLLLPTPSDDQASVPPSVLVISGTVTDALLPSVLAVIDHYPDAQLMSFGACATSGGPYWDSPPVTKGIDQFSDVAVYVAGCPPRPEALVAALLDLAQAGVSS